MSILNHQQQAYAIKALKEYMSAPAGEDGMTPLENGRNGDGIRLSLINGELGSLINTYLHNQIELAEFKTKLSSINSKNRKKLWAFSGISGQMFFNILYNTTDNLIECDQEIKAAITLPQDDKIALSRIRSFTNYVKRMGDNHLNAGNSGHGKPKTGCIPYFLSYFWKIQEPSMWSIFFTGSTKALYDMNLWQPTGDLAEDFINFNNIHLELRDIFKNECGCEISMSDVEHVVWYKRDTLHKTIKPAPKIGNHQVSDIISVPIEINSNQYMPLDILPESHVPPIIAILPRIAQNDEALVAAATNSGTTLPNAFEKFINVAFTMLGYDATLLGQGKGRVPDGLAISEDDSYAILWDAKVRTNGYNMGTDDRAIREYITTQSREIKRRRYLRNIYYLLISSGFSDVYDDMIRSIKMDTDVNEVILLEAEALVSIVEAKLRDPRLITLGPDGIQRLFTTSGIITASDVEEYLP